MKVLFPVSEVYPLLKTGGLGDVAYSLPHALKAQGADVRLLLPGYRDVLEQVDCSRILGWLEIPGAGRTHDTRLIQARHEAFEVPLWLLDCPALFDRPGNPYLHPDGHDWPDNAERYTVFAHAAAMLAQDALHLNWHADVVHSHDWQTGLVSAFLEGQPNCPRRVFTIHNMAYGGYFSHDTYQALQLPDSWWNAEGVEFYGNLSMLKAGIVYADAVTTVSPTYAREICTAEYGYGLDGVLSARRHKLHGILNGIDDHAWDPASDPALAAHYDMERVKQGKAINKKALLRHFDVAFDDSALAAPLIGSVGRLVEQKGIDLLLDALPAVLEQSDARLVILGSGQALYEHRLHELASSYPGRVMVQIGYSETLAHLIEAGADMFVMPSRFEPCGLNQLYSLRYGTPPIVHRTGGLADTVINAEPATLKDRSANGFVFDDPTAEALRVTLTRALDFFADRGQWHQLQRNGMQRDSGWGKSAMEYLSLYLS